MQFQISLHYVFRTTDDSNFCKYYRGLPWWPSGGASPSCAGVQVQSLVKMLRSHLPCSPKTKTKQRQEYNKFNKDF